MAKDASLSASIQQTVQRVRQEGNEWSTSPHNDIALAISVGTTSDTFQPWGYGIKARDRQLRAFWPTEPWLASAVCMRAMSRASMSFRLDGPPKTVAAIQRLVQMADLGRGLESLMSKVSIDLDTQDNGAFVEVVRQEPIDHADIQSYARGKRTPPPMINLVHLDSGCCYRTGDPLFPVIYVDPMSAERIRLSYLDVLTFSELPSPIATLHGVQLCFVSRVLREAQFIRDLETLKGEKASGRFIRRVHLVGGVQTKLIDDKMNYEQDEADNKGMSHYIHPIIIGGLDPKAGVSVATIDLAEGPGEKQDEYMRYYIGLLALAGGDEYQDLFPLPGQGIGTSNQSTMLHRKARQRGRASWKRMWSREFNFRQILPANVHLSYEENDIEDEKAAAEVRAIRATTRATQISSGEINSVVAAQMAVDNGDLDVEYLEMMGASDVTQDIVVGDLGDVSQKESAEDEFSQSYYDALSALAGDAISRSVDRAEFMRLGTGLVEKFIPGAYNLGLGGEDSDSDDEAYLKERISLDIKALESLADYIYSNSEKEETGIAAVVGYVAERLSVIKNKLGEIIAIGMLAIKKEQRYEWALGRTKSSCETCQRLAGQVHTNKQWRASGYRPKSSLLKCHGDRCDCRFRLTNKPLVGGF